ncbi:hypothetical protein T265_02748 [Opisthorchis viverrini]|uniref:Uncharacterized protein n=1 Tax=Opisthorchis viverrini TaxID=6198 RepID=A0A074ZTY1_OPIVI|nr:hypothetical protein T265_02748 [Opisthorchis viverrini]KER30938.1 hypothetical protein T265_02748 [Opisthorchis viverrini]
MTRGIYGVGVALSPRAERALLDWIPVNSSLRRPLSGCRHKKGCLFVVSAYSPTDGSSNSEKDPCIESYPRTFVKRKALTLWAICSMYKIKSKWSKPTGRVPW